MAAQFCELATAQRVEDEQGVEARESGVSEQALHNWPKAGGGKVRRVYLRHNYEVGKRTAWKNRGSGIDAPLGEMASALLNQSAY